MFFKGEGPLHFKNNCNSEKYAKEYELNAVWALLKDDLRSPKIYLYIYINK